MGTFKCSDGYVNIASPTERMWIRFLDAIEDDWLRHIENYKTPGLRMKHKEALQDDINTAFRTLSTEFLVTRLKQNGVPCGPVLNVAEGFTNPQAEHLKIAKPAPHRKMGDINLIRSPINLSETQQPHRFERAAPDPGEHTREVLSEFGFATDRIDALYESGAIG